VSIFGSIMSKIFGHTDAAEAQAAPQAAPGSAAAQPAAASAPQATSPSAPVDVEAVLSDLASKNPQTLDWRHSIVDLMKLLNLDSSLSVRKELALELHYSGDTNDSASMNIWHKQVMLQLAENGGKIPESLRS
jgi:3-oxoacyl-ACP reductase-like protein